MTTLETDVEPLDVLAAQLVFRGSLDPYLGMLLGAMRQADADQLDVLEKAYPELVYAERVRRTDEKRLGAVAIYRPRHQCPECGWPTFDGYRNSGSMDGDVDPYGFCRNRKCNYEY
jgi:hypothetical protein